MFDVGSIESSEEVSDYDLIPYALTGSRVLHNQGFKGKGVKVAVIDSGADYNHEALSGVIKERNLNFCNYAKNNSMDDHPRGHGTHVASTIATIAPEAEIVPIKVIAPYGGENEWVIKAVEYVASRDDIDVVNMSISAPLRIGTADYNALHSAIKACVDKNIFVVVASGNTGKETTLYPACFEEVTTVGAVDINRYEALFSTLSNQVDMCQVGVDVIGAKLGGGYVKMSGTSMATPMVAGIAALLIGKHKEQNSKRPDGRLIHYMLKLSAIDINVKGLDTKTGAGFISLDPSASVLEFTVGSNKCYVNGNEFMMDAKPYINPDNDRTYLPVRYANIGKHIVWNGIMQKITIV